MLARWLTLALVFLAILAVSVRAQSDDESSTGGDFEVEDVSSTAEEDSSEIADSSSGGFDDSTDSGESSSDLGALGTGTADVTDIEQLFSSSSALLVNETSSSSSSSSPSVTDVSSSTAEQVIVLSSTGPTEILTSTGYNAAGAQTSATIAVGFAIAAATLSALTL